MKMYETISFTESYENVEEPFLTLDIKRRKVRLGFIAIDRASAHCTAQSIIVPVIDARENYDPIYRLEKRGLDVIVASLILLLFSSLILVISLLIKVTSRGPVIYKQERTGKNGKRFKMWKFRTMNHNSEVLGSSLRDSSHLKHPDFKLIRDPRVTLIGKFLRKFSIDELPNLINVLKGDMSLVGPRPTSFRPGAYKKWHMARLKATPGVTGLQQVSGRANLQFDERVLLDINYIIYQSILYDMYILLKTISIVISTKGAY